MTKPFPAPIPPTEEHQGLQSVKIRCVAISRQLLRESGWWATRKKKIGLIIRVAVTLALFAFLLKSVSWSTLGAILAYANRLIMLLGLAIGTFGLVVSSVQWQSLLRAERITTSISKLIRLSLVGIAFNHFLPGGIGGEAVKVLYVRRESGNGAGSICAVVMSRFTGFFGMLLVALPVLLIWLSHFASTLVVWFVLLSLLIGCVFCGAIFSTTLVSRVAKGSWIKNHLTSHRVLDEVVHTGNAIRISARRPHSLCVALVFGILFWVTSCLNYYIYGFALQADVPLYFYFVAIPLVALVTLLPISINGFGVRESAFVYIFSTAHVPPATSLILAFVMDGQMLLFGVLGGYIYLTMSSKIIPHRPADAPSRQESGAASLHTEVKQSEHGEGTRPLMNDS